MLTKSDGTKLAYISGVHVPVALVADALLDCLEDALRSDMTGEDCRPLTHFFCAVMSESYSPSHLVNLVDLVHGVTKSPSDEGTG